MMATLQEYANRQRYGGVSVYSPTRPIVRPTGTVANSGTARRILQRDQPNPVYGGPPQFGRPQGQVVANATTSRRTALDDILESIDAQAPAPQEQGGWKGALGTVVNSTPFKVAMAPLNILDIPRRAIVSTVNEVADAFNGGDASFDDWFDQVKDPTFGFGDVVGSTGNIWADRFIGFVGDVALDPLTYVAGAGVWSGTGRAARQRLAGLAASQGLPEEVISKIGRYGLSGIDNATRERLRQATTLLGDAAGEQILDRGYYLKLPFRDTFHRLPGTAKLDQFVSPVFARGRARLAESRLGVSLRSRLRSPEVMREATEKLITGRGNMSYDDAAGIYFYVNAQRSVGNTATSRFTAEGQAMMRQYRGPNGHKQLNDMIEVAETEGNTTLNHLFDRAAQFMRDAGIDFYPRKNYIPHILTQPALAWLRGATDLANNFRKALIPGLEINDISPRLMQRHLLPNTTHEVAGREFRVTSGTIKDLNAEFARVFPELDFKLFDDEITSILAVYGLHLGDDIGRAGALKALLNSKSRLVRLRSEEGMVNTLVNEEALDLLNKETADMLRGDLRSISDSITRLRDAQLNDTMGLQGLVGVHLRETLEEVQGLERELKDELDGLIAEEMNRAHEMGRTSTATGLPSPLGVGALETKLEMAYDVLEAKALASDQRLAGLQPQAAAELMQWNSLKRLLGSNIGMNGIPEQFAALRQWNAAVAEAATLSMDREALLAMRQEVAEAIRKADLLEGMAEDPAMVGRAAGYPSPREEWHASIPVRINEEGQLVRGPPAGVRGGEPVTAATGRVVPWDPIHAVDQVVANATRLRTQLIEGAEAIPGRPAIPSAARVQEGVIAGAEARRAQIGQNILDPAEELALLTERDQIAVQLNLFERTPEGQQLAADRELLTELQGQLGNVNRAIERTNVRDGRAAIVKQAKALQRQVDEVTERITQGEAQVADLTQRTQQIDQAVAASRDLERQVEAVNVPDQANMDGLRDLNNAVNDRQAKLAAAERRVHEASAMHARYVDEAAERVELAVNQERYLLMRENDLEGVFSKQEQLRRARRETEAHRNGELHQARQTFEHAQRPIKRAVAQRDEIATELEGLKRQLADGPLTPEPLRARFARINEDERVGIQRARAASDPVRTEWMTFPQARVDAPSRRRVYTFEQRDRLGELYDIVRNTHPVDKAGGSSAKLVRQARQTIRDIGGRGGPAGPREVEALREAHLVLRTLKGKGSAAHARYRRALKEINAIEAEVTGGVTLAQHEYGEVLRINDLLDDLEQARTPLRLPSRGSKKYKAVALSPRAPGADTTVSGRAKANRDIADDWVANYSQDLVDEGAIDSVQIEHIRRQRDEVDSLLKVYEHTATPEIQHMLNQAGADLGRMVGVMLSYRQAIAAGYKPSAQVGAAIALHHILRERNGVDSTIRQLEDLVKVTPEERIAKFNRTIESREFNIAKEQAIIDDPDVDDLTRKRAVGRRDYQRRKLREVLDVGIEGEGGRPVLQGIVEDEVDTMVSFVEAHLDDWYEASNTLNAVKRWRDVYTSPIEKKIQLENNAERMPGILAQRQASFRRLETSLNAARRAGRDRVGYTPWEWKRKVTIDANEAQRRLDNGEIPEYLRSTVQTRVNEKRRSYESAIRSGRKPPNMEISYSPSGAANKPITLTIEEAEAELIKRADGLADAEAAIYNNQIQLDVMTGRGDRRIAEIQAMLGDAEAPLNESAVRTLNNEARKIRQEANRRPGKGLSAKLTADEQHRIDVIEARIEQAQTPLGEADIIDLNRELDERELARDAYHHEMEYDVELMQNVTDNGYRMFSEIVAGMRSPTVAEARVIRLLIGQEQGELAVSVQRALDDYISGSRAGGLTEEAWQDAWRVIKEIHAARRPYDDGLDRIIPTEEAGRALRFGELVEASQVNAEVATILGDSGRNVQRNFSIEGDRERILENLVGQARIRFAQANKQMRQWLDLLDIQVDPPIEMGGFIRKYLGGDITEFTKKELTAHRVAGKVIHTVPERRRDKIRETILAAFTREGYDPLVSVERRLSEARAQRSRLTSYLSGLGMVAEDSGIADFPGFTRWWTEASLAEMGGRDIRSLDDLLRTLRAPDEVEGLALARRQTVTRQLQAARRSGDTEAEAALQQELESLTAGRLRQPELVEGVAPAPAVEPERRAADPSERAVAGVDTPADPEELTRVQTELEQVQSRQAELNEELGSLHEQQRAMQREAQPPDTPPAGPADLSRLEQLAVARRPDIPEGYFSRADVRLAIERYTAYADSIPDDMTPEQAAMLEQLSNEMDEISARAWRGESKQQITQANRVADEVSEARQRAAAPPRESELLDPDAEANRVEAITQNRARQEEINNELDTLDSRASTLQRRANELNKAHVADEPADIADETPSMLEDPLGAEQAEGLPPTMPAPEDAPAHLVDDHIFDSDASPEDLMREYEIVVAQSRKLLEQYGSYRAMPPDVRRQAGELANRAKAIGDRRAETFAHAAKALPTNDQKRLITALQTSAEAANPRVDLDWWTVISTGSPPSGVATRVARLGRGFRSQRGRLRRVVRERGELRGRGGSRFRASLSAKERILRGEHAPISKVPTPVTVKRGPLAGRVIRPRKLRQPTLLERRAGMREPLNQAQRDLRGMAERARVAATEGTARLEAAEAGEVLRQRRVMEELEGVVSGPAIERRQEALAAQHDRLVHANDELAQEQRRRARIDRHYTRVQDAYTRALETANNQLGDVRRRVIETQVDHESAARYLTLATGALREPKNSNLNQIYGDIKDLMEFKRAGLIEPEPPIEMPPIGGWPTPPPGWPTMPPRPPGKPPRLPPLVPVSSSQPEIRQIEALLAAAWDQQRKIDDMQIHHDLISKRLKDFERAPKKHAFYTPEQMLADEANVTRFEDVFIHQVADGWQAVAEDMFTGADALVISSSLQTAMDNIRRTIREPGFWKMIEKYTAFFSSYAIMRPGFHVRNAMSGTFMNMVDGVKIRHMRRAPGIWRDFMRDPEGFWARTGAEADKQRMALMAVFGSGATGQFSESGLTAAATTGGKIYRKVMNNFLTKMNRKAGSYVEGPLRLAMALDTVERGGTINTALDRITKFHFDYTQLSEMDVVARRLIPFWTFMSRNLPLQIESMWLRPRTYLQYQSLVRNFGEEMHPLTPDYWISQGAFTVDENAPQRDEPWYLAPDLPHLRVAEPFIAASQGDLGRAVLSDINPIFLAPLEAYAAGKKFYTGAQITDELREPVGPIEERLQPLLQLIGGGETAASGQGLIDPRAAHVASATLPPIEFLSRLFSEEGTRAGRQDETILRTLGAPVYQLTEPMQQSTLRTNRYNRQRERERQALLARS